MSTVSSTACTRTPNAGPNGRSAIGEGRAAVSGAGSTSRSASSVTVDSSGSDVAAPGSPGWVGPALCAAWASAVSDEYDDRRHARSSSRSKRATSRRPCSTALGTWFGADRGSTGSTASSGMPSAASSAHTVVSSVIVTNGSGSEPGARPRERSIRLSADDAVCDDGAHHVTTWPCARVRAT